MQPVSNEFAARLASQHLITSPDILSQAFAPSEMGKRRASVQLPAPSAGEHETRLLNATLLAL